MKIIDVHIYLGQWHWPLEDKTASDTLKVMDANSIDCGIAVGSEAIGYDFVESNAWVANEVKTDGQNRLFGYVLVNGHYVKESLAELDKYLTKSDFLGVKIHPSYSNIAVSHPNFEPIFDRIAEIGKPVLIHTDSTPTTFASNLVPVARRHPKLALIMGHMGRDHWGGAILVAAEVENIYMDPCCSFPDAGKIELAVEKAGAESLLYGSAMVENHPAFTSGMILDAEISQQQRELIFSGNAERLFDFPKE